MRLIGAIAAALLLCLSVPPARAAEPAASAWAKYDQGAVRLVSAVTGVGRLDQVQLGLQFRLKPGWKIYWRSPGSAGYPPSIDWKGSDNLADTVLSWPAPRRFSVNGMDTMGYKEEVLLPITARLAEAGRPLALQAAVDFLTCDVLCVPGHVRLSLDLPAADAEPSASAHLIGRFLARVPGNGAGHGLALAAAKATEDGGLKVIVTSKVPLLKPDLFVERGDQMQFTRPQVRVYEGGRRVVLEVQPVPGTGEGDLLDKAVTLTVVDGERSMEVATEVAPAEPGSAFGRLVATLGVALLGGLILNLMPCVLPVLSLKLLGVVAHAGAGRRVVRAGFLASAAGVVASFLLLAGAAVALRAAGAAVGWGIQFQQPLFLVAMVCLLTLFAANLFGWFDIVAPGRLAQAGDRWAEASGLPGHFATGMFATLLATPCSAPFVGTAIGYALSRGAPEVFGTFAAMGLGMAAPYLVVAAWPGLARTLPRPGRWMLWLRRLLGLLLAATAAWLLLVMANQAGRPAAIAVAGSMLGLLLVLALGRGRRAILRSAVAAGLVIAAGLAPGLLAQPSRLPLKVSASGPWERFDRDAINRHVDAGKVVLVDVTADWCITCQVNKAAVLNRGQVAGLLASADTVAMQADWTRPDDAITAYLASFGRYGVPFDVVYGPGAPDGIVLSELLSEQDVLEAVEKARKPGPGKAGG